MNTHLTTNADLITKKIKRLMIIIALLIIIILSGIIYFLIYKKMAKQRGHSKSVSFVQQVPDNIAGNGTGNYRTETFFTGIASSTGVLYDTAEIGAYLRGPYKDIIARQIAYKPLPAGYQWRLGFYWMVLNTGGVKQLGFYVIPLAYSPTKNQVLDYFTDSFYYHPSSTEFKSIYDEGHLWP